MCWCCKDTDGNYTQEALCRAQSKFPGCQYEVGNHKVQPYQLREMEAGKQNRRRWWQCRLKKCCRSSWVGKLSLAHRTLMPQPLVGLKPLNFIILMT
ncbi:hypothetical protein C5167_016771 [Papaver somniferum]|nr:hypothetical protein C5167_016771 [Papaver somniferum]